MSSYRRRASSVNDSQLVFAHVLKKDVVLYNGMHFQLKKCMSFILWIWNDMHFQLRVHVLLYYDMHFQLSLHVVL